MAPAVPGPPPPVAAAPVAPAPAPAVAPPLPAPGTPSPAAATKAAAVAPPTEASKAPTGTPKTAEAGAQPRSYERLVEEGDGALENGQTAKAQKMYDEALRLQPNGVAAMTGSAYLLMDRRRPLAAIGLFKQALSNAPNYAPALFGLGEAYRSEGEAAQAIESYKRYLDQSPNGNDAPAATSKADPEDLAGRPSRPGTQGHRPLCRRPREVIWRRRPCRPRPCPSPP